MKNRRKKNRHSSPQSEDKEVFFAKLRACFHHLFAPVPLPLLDPRPLSPSQELRQRQDFSAWVDRFKDRGGFELFWQLQSRRRIPPDTAVYILVQFQREDMKWKSIERGEEIKKRLQNRKGRKWISKRFKECADILTELGSILTHIPHRRVFPLQMPTSRSPSHRTPMVIEDLRLLARWVEELPPPGRGRRHKDETWRRAITLSAYFKGITGYPLYEYTAKLISRAFPETHPIDEKDTAIKRMKSAIRVLSLNGLPETAVPEEAKVGKAAKRAR